MTRLTTEKFVFCVEICTTKRSNALDSEVYLLAGRGQSEERYATLQRKARAKVRVLQDDCSRALFKAENQARVCVHTGQGDAAEATNASTRKAAAMSPARETHSMLLQRRRQVKVERSDGHLRVCEQGRVCGAEKRTDRGTTTCTLLCASVISSAGARVDTSGAACSSTNASTVHHSLG